VVGAASRAWTTGATDAVGEARGSAGSASARAGRRRGAGCVGMICEGFGLAAATGGEDSFPVSAKAIAAMATTAVAPAATAC
jgi:hypothetical protein